jgi:hypothetical protein
MQARANRAASRRLGTEQFLGFRSMADPVLQPGPSARLAFLVAPEVFADINALVLLDPLIADITGVTPQLIEEGFLIVFLFRLTRHSVIPSWVYR